MAMSKGFLALIIIVYLASGCAPPYYRPVPIYDSAPPPPPATPAVSVEDVITLSRAGVSEEVILAKIQTAGVIAKPSTEQIVALKQAGVSDRVIEAMLTARAPVAAAPERPVLLTNCPIRV
jgi:hypothetical protein